MRPFYNLISITIQRKLHHFITIRLWVELKDLRVPAHFRESEHKFYNKITTFYTII